MALHLANYQKKAAESVRSFWANRGKASVQRAKPSKGSARSNNMEGFVSLLTELVAANGPKDATVIQDGKPPLTLPGHFLPVRKWDLLVLRGNRLVAALALQSHVSPFKNNVYTRSEDAIVAGMELWSAYRKGELGESPRPFVGWLMLVEDVPGSRRPIQSPCPHFSVRPEFQGASYIERYNLLGKKMAQEQLYTTTAVLASPATAIKDGAFLDVSDMTSLKTFVTSFAGHLAAEAAR